MRNKKSLNAKIAAICKLANVLNNTSNQPIPKAAPKPTNAPVAPPKPLAPTPPTPNPAAKLPPVHKPGTSLTEVQKRVQPEVKGLKPEVQQPQEKSKGVLGGIQNTLADADISKMAPFMGMAAPLFEGVGGVAGIPGVAGLVDLMRGGKNIGVLSRGITDRVSNMFSGNQTSTPAVK